MQLSNLPGRKSLWSSGLGGCISYKRLAFLSLLCCDPSIFRARHHYTFKLQPKLKYLTKNIFGINEFVKVHLLKLPAAPPHPPTPSYPYDQLFLSCAVSLYYYTTIPCIQFYDDVAHKQISSIFVQFIQITHDTLQYFSCFNDRLKISKNRLKQIPLTNNN